MSDNAEKSPTQSVKPQALEGKKAKLPPRKLFVSLDPEKGDLHTATEVREADAAGAEVVFLFEKGLFLEMSEMDIRSLGRDNKTRYHVAADMNARHDPEADGLSSRISFVGQRNRRAETVAQFGSIPSSMSASRKLTGYAGHGFKLHFARPDKVEHFRDLGYDFVKAGKDGNPEDPTAFINGVAVDGHFEIKSRRTGATELVAMRVPIDQAKRIQDEKSALADRQVAAASEGTSTGLSKLDAKDGLDWQDR